jgi:hypothetical protein
MGELRPGQRPGRRLTLTEAAEDLGMSRDAVRMRVRRGSLESEKGEDGRVYVFVEPDQDTVHPEAQDESSSSPLVDALKDEISHLRRESERKDAIIMSLSQSNAELSRTIRAIEAPSSPSAEPESPEGSPDSPTEGFGLGEEEFQRRREDHEGPEPGEASRPWWRRVFGA